MAFLTSVFSLAAAIAYQPDDAVLAQSEDVSSSSAASSESSAAEESRQTGEDFSPKVLKAYEGYVAVFEQGGTTPIRILEKRIADLPEATAKRLESGITANTSEEYLSYLEDFS